MASLAPGLGAGLANNVANQYAADAAATVAKNATVDTNLRKSGRDQGAAITNG